MQPSAHLRVVGVRAAVVGGIATLVGVLGHLRAGGATPDVPQLCGLWLLCGLVSAPLMMRPAGWLRLTSVLLVEQVLVHAGLMAVAMGSQATAPGMQPMPSMSGMPGMQGMTATSMPSMSPVPSPQMLMMHSLAAAVVGLWLWRGECALVRLIRRARVSIGLLWPIVLVRRAAARRRAVAVRIDLLPLWGLRCAHTVQRRGPPLAGAL